MKYKIPPFVLASALAASVVALSGCVAGRYGHGWIGWTDYPYHAWYDEYYGLIYDGYWGLDGVFYFRLKNSDSRYHRDNSGHFRRDDMAPSSRYRRIEGVMREPERGTYVPKFPRDQRR